jgi:hypothetical protein
MMVATKENRWTWDRTEQPGASPAAEQEADEGHRRQGRGALVADVHGAGSVFEQTPEIAAGPGVGNGGHLRGDVVDEEAEDARLGRHVEELSCHGQQEVGPPPECARLVHFILAGRLRGLHLRHARKGEDHSDRARAPILRWANEGGSRTGNTHISWLQPRHFRLSR